MWREDRVEAFDFIGRGIAMDPRDVRICPAKVPEILLLEPHCDDLAGSIGSLIASLVEKGARLWVARVCDGDAPTTAFLNRFARQKIEDWKLMPDNAMQVRRAEDRRALCEVLGVPRDRV